MAEKVGRVNVTPESSPFVIIPIRSTGLGKPPLARQPQTIPPAILSHLDHADITWAVTTLNDNIKRAFVHLDKKKHKLRTRGAGLAVLWEFIICLIVGVVAWWIGTKIAMSWVAWILGAMFVLVSLVPGIRAARLKAQFRQKEQGTVSDTPWLYSLLQNGCERLTQKFGDRGLMFILPLSDPVFSVNSPKKRYGVDSPFFRAFVVIQIDPHAVSEDDFMEGVGIAAGLPMLVPGSAGTAVATTAVGAGAGAPKPRMPADRRASEAFRRPDLSKPGAGTLTQISSTMDYSMTGHRTAQEQFGLPPAATAHHGAKYYGAPISPMQQQGVPSAPVLGRPGEYASPQAGRPMAYAVPGAQMMFY